MLHPFHGAGAGSHGLDGDPADEASFRPQAAGTAMQRRYVTIDVFTDRAFGGNPLAVVLDAQGLGTAQMQAVAREFGYSETTFVLPPAAPTHTARVRIFTPGTEIPFAGHPNVGTALVLARRAAAPPDACCSRRPPASSGWT